MLAELEIYTDGACSGNPGPGGWGVVVPSYADIGYDGFYGSAEKTTNNEMELCAIYEALRFCAKSGRKTIAIFSDSAYCVNAISKGWLYTWQKNGWFTSKGTVVVNKELWQKVYRQLQHLRYDLGIEVRFVKVEGHAGVIYNEYADQLAVKGRDEAKRKVKAKRRP